MLFFFKNFWPGIIWGCVILALTLLPGNYFPQVGSFWNLFSPDKLVHLFIFGVFGFLLLTGTYKQYPDTINRYIFVWPLLVVVLMGVVTETLQAVLPIGRDANIYDLIANIIGCLLGWVTFSELRKKKKKYLQTNANND